MAFPYDQTQAENLIDGLLTPNTITHSGLLEAIRYIPREFFVPDAYRGSAYADEEIPLAALDAPRRFLMEPLVQARLIQALDPQSHESVLIIGGATGYASALLSRLVARVEMVEEESALVAHAQDALKRVDATNVHVVNHPLTKGAPGAAPYDAILIEGAVRAVPATLFGQLKEGGRLLVIENRQLRPGTRSGLGQAYYYEKIGKTASARPLFDAGVSLLPGFEAEEGFSFN